MTYEVSQLISKTRLMLLYKFWIYGLRLPSVGGVALGTGMPKV